jgi:hypothetical protein
MMFKTDETSSALLATGVAAALLSTAAWADPGHSHGAETAYGKPGDSEAGAHRADRDAQVDGRMLFLPDTLTARRGEQIAFSCGTTARSTTSSSSAPSRRISST